MTPLPVLLAALDRLGAVLRPAADGSPRLAVPASCVWARPHAAVLGPAIADHREAVLCHLHPGRACIECGATAYTDSPAELLRLCGRVMCPGYDRRAWPDWYDSSRWFEQKRRAEAAETEARGIPE